MSGFCKPVTEQGQNSEAVKRDARVMGAALQTPGSWIGMVGVNEPRFCSNKVGEGEKAEAASDVIWSTLEDWDI